MCDLAYVNFLREKVRQQEAEEKRLATFGSTPSRRFVPFVLTSASGRAAEYNQTNRQILMLEEPCGTAVL